MQLPFHPGDSASSLPAPVSARSFPSEAVERAAHSPLRHDAAARGELGAQDLLGPSRANDSQLKHTVADALELEGEERATASLKRDEVLHLTLLGLAVGELEAISVRGLLEPQRREIELAARPRMGRSLLERERAEIARDRGLGVGRTRRASPATLVVARHQTELVPRRALVSSAKLQEPPSVECRTGCKRSAASSVALGPQEAALEAAGC